MSEQPTLPTCPKCGRDFVQPVTCQGFLEEFVSMFFMQPFRCQLCAHRFLYGKLGARYDTSTERRQYLRVDVEFPVSFTGYVRGNGWVTNISMGGCAIQTDAMLAVGKVLDLQLHTSEEEAPISVAAAVRNVRRGIAGVEFLRFTPEEKDRLLEYVTGQLMPQRQ